MSNALVVLLTLAGFFSVAGLFIYFAVRSAGGWRKKLDAVLLPIGFLACPGSGEKALLAQKLRIVNARHAGKRLPLTLYRRPSPQDDCDLYVCDYRFASGSGRARGAGWVLVCLVSRDLQLPRFTIESVPDDTGMAARLFNTLSDNFALPKLTQIPSEPLGLDRRFRVYVEPGKTDAIQAFGSSFANALLGKAGVGLDAQGDCLILSSTQMIADQVRQSLDSQKLLGLIHLASSLHQELKAVAVK